MQVEVEIRAGARSPARRPWRDLPSATIAVAGLIVAIPLLILIASVSDREQQATRIEAAAVPR